MELAAACVTRSIELPEAAQEVWTSLGTGDGLGAWLGDGVDLEPEVGAAGSVVDGATVRRIVVTEVDAGRSIGFVWWDESAPEAASTVTIALSPDARRAAIITSGNAGSLSVAVWLHDPIDRKSARECARRYVEPMPREA